MTEHMHPEGPESQLREDKITDEEQFAEMDGLAAEGWEFGGYEFGADSRYHVRMKKDGQESEEFVITKPNPQFPRVPEVADRELKEKKG